VWLGLLRRERLERKKTRFSEAVKHSAQLIAFDEPEIAFWKERCPDETTPEPVHAHHEAGIICVCEKRLLEMNDETIDKTAQEQVSILHNPAVEKKQEPKKTHPKKVRPVVIEEEKPESPIWRRVKIGVAIFFTLVFIAGVIAIWTALYLKNGGELPIAREPTDIVVEPVMVNKTVTELKPQVISLLPIVTNAKNLSKQPVEALGFLKRGVKNNNDTGIFSEFLTDEYGTEIELTGLTLVQKSLFPRKGITSEVYLVKGTFKNYVNPTIQVTDITPAERPMFTEEKVISVFESGDFGSQS
jgi:hypothetical protein